jgi:hypothetical protein
MATPMDLSWLAPLLTGAGNLATASGDMTAARQAGNIADPWGSNRAQYQTGLNTFMGDQANNPMNAMTGTNRSLGQLNQLISDPSSLTTMPGYQWGMNQALEGVNRGAGASGLLNSGNRLTALQDRAEGYAQSWQNQIYNQLLGNVNANVAGGNQFLNAQGQGFGQLANLAGVNAGSPVANAQLMMQGRTNQANSIGAGIGGIANGAVGGLSAIQRLIGSPGSGTSGVGLNGEQFGTGGDWGSLGGSSGGAQFGTGGDWGSDFNWTGSDYGLDDLTSLFGP